MCPVLQLQLENKTRSYWKTSSLQGEAQYDETAPLTTPHHPLRIPRLSADPLGFPAEHWTLLISSAVLLRDIFFSLTLKLVSFLISPFSYSHPSVLLPAPIDIHPSSASDEIKDPALAVSDQRPRLQAAPTIDRPT